MLYILINLSCFGQENKIGLTAQLNSPSKDNIGIGWFNIDSESIDEYNLKHSSYSLGLIAHYRIAEDMTTRVRFGYTHIGILEYSNFDLAGVNFNESNNGTQDKIHFAPGIYWPVAFKKVEFYGGFEIPINLHGQFKADYIYIQTDLATNSIIYEEHSTQVLPNGYSIGIGALLGFNYLPTNWFSLGAEFSPNMLYARLSGKTTWSDQNGNTFNTQDENKGVTFYDTRFSLNINFWF